MAATSRITPFLTVRSAPLHSLLLSRALQGPLLLEVVVWLIVASFIAMEVQSMWHKGFLYFINVWNYSTLISHGLVAYSVAMRMAPYYYMQSLYDFPRTSPFPSENEYISYDKAFEGMEEYKNATALNIFLCWIKLFKYLQFVPFMRVLVRALANASVQVWSFMIMAVVATMGFVLAHHLALGHQIASLRNMHYTLLTLYRMLLGYDAYHQMRDAHHTMGPLLYYAWTLVGYFLLLNLFFAILNGALERTKKSLPKVSFWANIVSFALSSQRWFARVLHDRIALGSLAAMDSKIGKLPISGLRNEPQKFLFDAYLLEKDAMASRLVRTRASRSHARAAETESQVVPGKQMEILETRLGQLVGTLTLLQRSNDHAPRAKQRQRAANESYTHKPL